MKKKVLGICGSPKKNDFSSSEFLLQEALDAAKCDGAEVKLIKLANYNILPCQGCGKCMSNMNCPLLSNPEDQLRNLYYECVEADAFIFSSPVYALSLPAIWKNWIDRCEPCNNEDLSYDYYCYDVVQHVKGKAFKGKVAGQIAVSAGPGHEWALASLMPAFTATKLSVVASVGLSLIEYDAQPGIKCQPWAKDIKEAEFAINIARAVGKRVYESIGYSTFKIDSKNRAAIYHEKFDISTMKFENTLDKIIDITSFQNKNIIFIASGQSSSHEAQKWFKKLNKLKIKQDKLSIFNLILVDKLPFFITKDFVKQKVIKNMKGIPCLFDWEMNFSKQVGVIQKDIPTIIIINSNEKKIKFLKSLVANDENFNLVFKVINDLIV